MPLSFQDMILRLQQYWSEQGCVVLQPYDSCMGAGTFHPATFLWSLGRQASACLLCSALSSPERWALWRQSASPAALLPVASFAQAVSVGNHAALSRQSCRSWSGEHGT